MIIFWLILAAMLGMAGLLLYFMFKDLLRKKTWAPRILNSVFLEVSIPKENTESQQEQQKEEKNNSTLHAQLLFFVRDRNTWQELHTV